MGHNGQPSGTNYWQSRPVLITGLKGSDAFPQPGFSRVHVVNLNLYFTVYCSSISKTSQQKPIFSKTELVFPYFEFLNPLLY